MKQDSRLRRLKTEHLWQKTPWGPQTVSQGPYYCLRLLHCKAMQDHPVLLNSLHQIRKTPEGILLAICAEISCEAFDTSKQDDSFYSFFEKLSSTSCVVLCPLQNSGLILWCSSRSGPLAHIWAAEAGQRIPEPLVLVSSGPWGLGFFGSSGQNLLMVPLSCFRTRGDPSFKAQTLEYSSSLILLFGLCRCL